MVIPWMPAMVLLEIGAEPRLVSFSLGLPNPPYFLSISEHVFVRFYAYGQDSGPYRGRKEGTIFPGPRNVKGPEVTWVSNAFAKEA